MKAKLKGQGGIKGLVLLHGEKLLIGLVGVGALYLAYSALGVERLPDQYEAEKLRAAVQRTSASIVGENNNWNKIIEQHPEEVRIDVPLKNEAMTIDPGAYEFWTAGIDPDVIAKRTPRGDPTLLAANDVRGHSGADLFAFIDSESFRQYDLRARQEAEKKELEQKRQQQLKQDDAGGGRSGGRRSRRGEDDRGSDFDPEHPNRRRITATSHLQGPQLQGG
jgi:hypothetical protein